MLSPAPHNPATPLSRPTEKAVRLATAGLETAEAMEAQGQWHEAAAVKMEALQEAAQLYRKHRPKLLRAGSSSASRKAGTFAGKRATSLGDNSHSDKNGFRGSFFLFQMPGIFGAMLSISGACGAFFAF